MPASCRNLGLPDSPGLCYWPDYRWVIRRTRYPQGGCRKALQRGGISPLGVLYRAIHAKSMVTLPRLLSKHGYGRNPAEHGDFRVPVLPEGLDAKTLLPLPGECRRNAGTDLHALFRCSGTVSGAECRATIVLLFGFGAVRGNILHLSAFHALLSAEEFALPLEGIAPPG